jgi:hypothetical protein
VSDTLTITLDDVVTEIRTLASEQPDFVYHNEAGKVGPGVTCNYRHNRMGDPNHNGTAGCIVGQALDRLGYVVPGKYEGSSALEVLAAGLDLNVDNRAAAWIVEVQQHQDKGEAWGEAVRHADDLFPQVHK